MTASPESLASARLWLAFATMLLVSGFSNTFAVFFPPLLREFGGSRGATGSTASLLWLGAAALGPVAGYLVSHWNPRLLISLGLAAAACGLALGTLAPSLPLFLLVVGVGGGIGVGLAGMVTHAALIAEAYVRRRGLAMGIAFSGSMAAYALAPPAQWAIDHLGWRGAFGCYAIAIAMLIPLAWRVHPSRLHTRAPSDAGAADHRPLGTIVRSVPFWSLLVVFATPPLLGYLATTQHTLYFTARGFSAEQASMLLAIGGTLAGAGRALAGLAADRLGAPLTGFVSFACSLTGVLCLLATDFWPAPVLAYAYVLFLFLPLGSRATIVSVLVSRIAPPAQYGVIFGLLGIGNSLGAAAGPWLSGTLYDLTGSYRVIYLWAVAVGLAGLLALVLFCLTTRSGVTRSLSGSRT